MTDDEKREAMEQMKEKLRRVQAGESVFPQTPFHPKPDVVKPEKLVEGYKADETKARMDLLAVDVLPSPFTPKPTIGKGPVALWHTMKLLRDWYHRKPGVECPPKDVLEMAFELLADALGVYESALARHAAAELAVAEVLCFGANKYADRNWEKGMRWGRCYSAALRHGYAIIKGEERDAETGLLHMAHFACCIMFLAAYVERGTYRVYDDRPLIPRMMPGFENALENADPEPAS